MNNKLVLVLSVVTAFCVALLYIRVPVSINTSPPVRITTSPPVSITTSPPVSINTSPPVSVNTSPPVSINLNTSVPRRFPPSDGVFVVVEKYTDQLSGALVGYFQMAQVTDSLNLSVVKPFVFHSELFGIPEQPTAPQLSDYFEPVAFQDLLHECSALHHPKRHTFDFQDFLVQSSRRLVIIDMRNSGHYGKVHKCHNTARKTTIERKLNTHVDKVREQAIQLHGKEGYKFRVIETLCATYNSRSPISVKDELVNGLALVGQVLPSRPTFKANTTSLILTGEWGRVSSTPTLSLTYDPSIMLQPHNCNFTFLPHTDLVMNYAQAFIRSLHMSRPIIAVHVRFEQLFRSAFSVFKTKDVYFKECLTNMTRLFEQLLGPHSTERTHDRGIFLQDMKKYGSKTSNFIHYPDLKRKCVHDVTDLLKHFLLKETQFDPRDPQFSGAPTEQTFVALVEQEALTMVDTLVLIGGGRYQENVLDKFLQTHSRKDLHLLCTRIVRN